MSSVAHSPAGAHDAHHVDNKFAIFVQLAFVLAVITGVEIVMVYLPWAKWMIVGGLTVLSVVKFMFVIFIFMHLRWDKPFCTILFFIGLILAVATVTALLQLFIVGDSYPIESAPPRTAAAAPAAGATSTPAPAPAAK